MYIRALPQRWAVFKINFVAGECLPAPRRLNHFLPMEGSGTGPSTGQKTFAKSAISIQHPLMSILVRLTPRELTLVKGLLWSCNKELSTDDYKLIQNEFSFNDINVTLPSEDLKIKM